MPSRRIVFVIAAVVSCGVAACGDKKPPAKKLESVDKPVAADARPAEATNEAEVARYQDEVAADHVPLKVRVSAAIAYRSFPKGDVIAALHHGDDVVQLAERYGFYRVTFPDPGEPSRKLMGWVGHFAFEDLPPIKKKLTLPRCTIGTGHPGTVLVVLEDPPRCAYVCKEAAECAATGTQCEARIVVPPSGEITSSPSYTTVCTARSPDAGKGENGSPPILFGAARTGSGTCPRLFTLAPKAGRLCYRSCKTDGDCPEGATCKAFGDKKLCASHWTN